MRAKSILTNSLAICLAACTPAFTPLPTNTLTPTITQTSTRLPTATATQPITPTSTPIVIENATDDCFIDVSFIPGKSEKSQVLAAWGEPSRRSDTYGGYSDWGYDFPGNPYVTFNKQTLNSITFFIRDCTLEKIFDKLGTPEKVEISVFIFCVGLQATYTQSFHYPSLGFSYFRHCDETQDCYIFYPNNHVDGKKFYIKDTAIQDSIGFNMANHVYDWHGFNVNVEAIEDKIEDILIIGTPSDIPK